MLFTEIKRKIKNLKTKKKKFKDKGKKLLKNYLLSVGTMVLFAAVILRVSRISSTSYVNLKTVDCS